MRKICLEFETMGVKEEEKCESSGEDSDITDSQTKVTTKGFLQNIQNHIPLNHNHVSQ
jgi:hypothetical protein